MTDGLALAIFALGGAYALAHLLWPFLYRALTGEWPMSSWRQREELERILRETYEPVIRELMERKDP